MFILWNLNIKAKQSKLILNYESNEAKQSKLFQKIYKPSKVNVFISKNDTSQAKGTELYQN
jgi:hypothetical protein